MDADAHPTDGTMDPADALVGALTRGQPMLGTWSWWPETGRMLWSSSVYEILGLDPDHTQPSLQAALDRVVEGQREDVRQRVEAAFAETDTIDTDLRIQRPDGNERTIHLVARSHQREGTTPAHWRGTIADTTDLPLPLREATQSEAAYRTLLGEFLAVVYRLRGDPVTGRLEFLGPYTHEVLGYEPATFRQDPDTWLQAVHREDRDAFQATRARVIDTGTPQHHHYRFRTGTGENWIVLEEHLFPIRDDGGDTVGLTGITRDVTAEQEQQMEYEALVHALPDFVMIVRQDGTIDEIPQTRQARGYRPNEDVLGQTVATVLPNGVGARLQEAIEQALQEQDLITLRYELEIDDEPTLFEGRVMPMDTGRALLLGRDITTRTEALLEVDRQAEDLRLAAEVAGLGYWSWWPESNRTEWSRGLYDLLGYDPETDEASYEAFMARVHPEDRDRVEAAITEGLEQEERWDTEYRVQRPSEDTRVLRSIGLVDEPGEKAPRMFGVSLDVTELRREQQRLKARAEELESANRELERFAHAAAHELKEPVRNVLSDASRLKQGYEEGLDAEGQAVVERIREGAQRMAKRLDDLLTYSQEGVGPRNAERVALGPVVEEVLGRFEDRLDAADARVEYEDLGAVMAERGDVVEVFEQLLDNAIRFRSDRDPLRVTIQARREGDQRVVSIEDNGRGLPEDPQDRLFELFEPLHGLADGGGAGVGLAICRRLIELYGGRLEAEGAPGEGATFTFSLPDASGTD